MPVGRLRNVRACMRAPFAVFAIALLTAMLIQTFGVQISEWQFVYVGAAGELIAGIDFYASGSGYVYPPFMAWVATPFVALPEWASRLCWFLLSATAMIVMMVSAWRLSGGGDLFRVPLSARREWIIFGVGQGCALTYILNAFAHQQTDVIVGGLLMGGAALLYAGNAFASAALLGVSAAFKATPLLWAPYLAWRGHWLAALVLVVVAVSVNLPADLIAAAPHEATWLQEWFRRLVLGTQSLSVDAGHWHSDLEYNQSLVGTVQRLINTDFAGSKGMSSPNPVLSPLAVKAIVYSLFLTLAGLSILASRRARSAWRDDSRLPPVQAWEYSLVLVMMLLLSPMSGRAHFGILLLPALSLARVAMVTGNRALWTILGLCVALTLVANKDLVGDFVYDTFLWAGATTAVAVLLWGGCVAMLWSGPPLPASKKSTAGQQPLALEH